MSIPAEHRYYLKQKALYYYYEKDYSYSDIAGMLGISRVTLNRLMNEAKAEGLIKIEILDSKNLKRVLVLEDKLRTRYGLKDVKLVDMADFNIDSLVPRLAAEGAKYVEQCIRSGMKVGICWGETLSTMLTCMNRNSSVTDLEVYSLLGGFCSEANFQPTLLAQSLLAFYSGRAYTINAPFVCHSRLLCSEIKKEPEIARILDICPSLDLAFVGVGQHPDRDRLKKSYYHFPDSVIDELLSARAVGDICGNFYDAEGRVCQTDLSSRIVSVSLQDLKTCKNVIAVAGGPSKVDSIRGALNGGYIHTLITDVNTAEAILAAG